MALGSTAIGSAAAALAITAAAVVMPGTVANADPITAAEPGLGSLATLYLIDSDAEHNDGIGGDHPGDPVFNGDGDFAPNFFENDFWWFGPSNSEAPPAIADFTIDIYSALPAFAKPIWGWFLNGEIDWEACVLGGSVKLGPYGSVTVGYASHC